MKELGKDKKIWGLVLFFCNGNCVFDILRLGIGHFCSIFTLFYFSSPGPINFHSWQSMVL